MSRYKFGFLMLIIFICPFSIFGTAQALYGAALTTGTSYLAIVDAIGSDGQVVNVGLRGTGAADSNGKMSFAVSGLPTRSSYNFLLVTIQDSGGTTVRRSIIPAPAAGGTVDIGVSPMTKSQTDAMLSAMATAGTDDPIMVLFGFIIVRSGGFTSDDITHLANLGRLAIRSGFNTYLAGKITAAQMALFRASIVASLGDYTSNLKTSVDAADSTTSKNERAEAAAMLSQILIDAAASAGFDVGYITAAMKAASDQAEDYLLGDGSAMDNGAVEAMDKVMMSNYMKLAAERVRKKYVAALTTLGGTQGQIDRLNTAITTLTNTLLAAFQAMEALFQDEETKPTASDVDSKFTTAQTSINNAFTQFMSDSAATNAEIDTMVTAMSTGFTIPIGTLNTMKDPNSDGNYADGMFEFREMGGTVHNWPITMVVPVTWVANTYGNNLTYTRDTITVPTGMTWLDADDDGDIGDANYQKRHDWDSTNNNGVAGDEKGIPAGMAALFGLREDIELVMAREWAGMAAASKDMTNAGYNKLTGADKTLADNQIAALTLTKIASEDTVAADDTTGATLGNFTILNNLNPWVTGEESQGLEDLALTRLATLSGNITATTDVNNNARAITAAEKQALMDTATMPDFQ